MNNELNNQGMGANVQGMQNLNSMAQGMGVNVQGMQGINMLNYGIGGMDLTPNHMGQGQGQAQGNINMGVGGHGGHDQQNIINNKNISNEVEHDENNNTSNPHN